MINIYSQIILKREDKAKFAAASYSSPLGALHFPQTDIAVSESRIETDNDKKINLLSKRSMKRSKKIKINS